MNCDRILAAKQRDAEADVSALEREIDQLVYALYGLTPDEASHGTFNLNSGFLRDLRDLL